MEGMGKAWGTKAMQEEGAWGWWCFVARRGTNGYGGANVIAGRGKQEIRCMENLTKGSAVQVVICEAKILGIIFAKK